MYIMSTKEEREFKINLYRESVKELNQQIEPLITRRDSLIDAAEALILEGRKELADSILVASFEEQASYYLNSENYRYDAQNVRSFFDRLGLIMDGIDPDTKQVRVSLMMRQDEGNFDLLLESLNKLEPIVDKNSRGVKVFSLIGFDSNLHLLKLKRDWLLFPGPYHRRFGSLVACPVKRSSSLKNMLAYIRENHYAVPTPTETEE